MHLNLSYNQISEAKGLRKLWGPNYQLRSLELQGNNLTSVEDLIQSLRGLQYLEELTLEKDGSSNPVCQMYGKNEQLKWICLGKVLFCFYLMEKEYFKHPDEICKQFLT